MSTIELHWKQLKPSPLNRLIRGAYFDETSLRELADSFSDNGVIEPLVIIHDGNDRYQIVSGERRWRAARLLGDDAPLLPCIIKDPMEELDQLVLMGVENLQRENMGPVSEARYYRALQDRGLDVPAIVQRTGKNRSRVDNRLQLLDLHPRVQELIESGVIPSTTGKSLRKLPHDLQVELVDKMRGRSRAAINKAVDMILERQERMAAAAVAGANGTNGRVVVRNHVKPALETITRDELELAARATCAACEVHREMRHELRWEAVSQALNDQCARCEVRDMREACYMCPLVDFLKALRSQTNDRGEPVGPEHLYQKGVLSHNDGR